MSSPPPPRSGASSPVGDGLPHLPPGGRKTPEQLAKMAQDTMSHKLVGRLYSSSSHPASGIPNILGPQSQSKGKTEEDIRRAPSDSTNPASGDPHTQTTTLNLLRQGREKGKAAAALLVQPKKMKEAELRSTLTSRKDRFSAKDRGKAQTRPSTAVTSLSATTGATGLMASIGAALHRDPEPASPKGEDDRGESPHPEDDPTSPFPFIKSVQAGDPLGKFLYLTIRPKGIKDLYNPYDLVAVPHKDTDRNNYFTIAKEGVTHVQNGEADFIPLEEWLREYRIFSNVLGIPFFRKFRRWKAFFTWKKHVRRTRVTKYKEYLEENLFILNTDLCPPLLHVRSICQDLLHLAMYAAFQETRTLEQYQEIQTRNREVTARRLDHKIREIRDIIDNACKAAMATSAPKPVVEDAAEALQEVTSKTARARTPIPASTEVHPQRQSYIELSQKRAVCRRLTSFIRLCDYMVIDSLVKLTMKSVEEVCESVLYPKPIEAKEDNDDDSERAKSAHELALEAAGVSQGMRKKATAETGPFKGPVFFLEVIFMDDGIAIQPSIESFLYKTESVIKGFTETIVRVERFVQMDTFLNYTKHVTSDHPTDSDLGVGPDVNEMVTGEETHKALVHTIRASLQAAFADVEEYVAQFETFKQMYIENRKLDPHQIKEDDPPLDWFRDERQKYHMQQQEIDKLPPQRDVAIFTVKTDKLKQILAPSPVACLEELEALLPMIAKEKNDKLMAVVTEGNKKLEREATTVEEFVEFIRFHSDIYARMDQISAEYDVIHEMYLLIMTELDNKGPSTHDDHLRFTEGTGPAVAKLRQMILQVEDTKDGLTRHFSDNVDEQHEELRKKMLDVADRGRDPMIDDEDADMDTVIEYVQGLMEEMEQVKTREKELTSYQELFDPGRINETGAGFEEELMEVYRTIADKLKLWTSLKSWQERTAEWNSTEFEKLDAGDVEAEVARYDKAVKQVDRTLKGNPVVPKLRGMVDEFRLTMPVIQCLKNPNLKEHHWSAIDDIVGKPLSQDPTYTLGVLMDLKVMDLKDEIQQVSNQATQEQQLDEMLQTVQKRWQGVEFTVNQYKEQKDTYVLGSVEDIMNHLEDSSVVIATIASNRFCTGGLKRRVEVWENDMRYMTETLDKWLEVQRKWMYLESIFSHKELQQQWPEDARSFLTVDKGFRELMKRTAGNPGVRSTLTQNNYTLLPQCKKDIDSLERIEKRLEEKLDQKRRLFPRFYFLSNDDLLDILAQIRNPDKIAPHMLKMFDNIKKLILTESADVTHMCSSEGEQVALYKIFKARGPVEKWLGETEATMVQTLRRLAKACWEDYVMRPRMEWIFQHPAQLVLVISQVYWAKGVVDAIKNGTMDGFKETCVANLRGLANATGQDLNAVSRSMLRTLITLDVHGRDLVTEMIEDKVVKVDSFGWTKQLRCYWEKPDDSDGHGDIVIRQNNSYFVYGYEYLGAMGRLVITPLTDRVFMTITGALHLCLGTAPAGPAGTGKTESVKDLAKGLGRQCIVYNCSDGVTYKMMETFFSGLCQTGAWCCLDEFNRIGIEVLSVIASQLHEIRGALLQQKGDPTFRSFTFQGMQSVDLKPTFGCCITMNPGYAGRTELPDN
eukprot:Sspe_Gene.12750::Locus_4355_Transcript_2_2_Confidence_0.222_Length_4895::g.12750::m.12750/K10408/DNAH; dynein heavy chain, axonemal